MRFENKKGQNEKNWKKNVFCNWNFFFFFYCSLLAGPLALHLKDDL
jgi:hypothetical protein